MPTTRKVKVFIEHRVLYGQAAANAGGVATSGHQMSQNGMRFNWTREEVEIACT
jgi:glutamate dehydrogenase (NADP+)